MKQAPNILAIIFDMDGVVVDSERHFRELESPFFRRFIPSWRDEDHHRIVGKGLHELHEFLSREFGLTAPRAEFVASCFELGRTVYLERAGLAPGILDLLKDLRGRSLAAGLATSSPRRGVDLILQRFSLRPCFDAVVTADDAPGRAKPAPDLYLLAASRLGHEPARCLAVEDSALGVRAAKAAGMPCLAFRNGYNQEQDLSAADGSLDSFLGIDGPALLARLGAREKA